MNLPAGDPAGIFQASTEVANIPRFGNGRCDVHGVSPTISTPPAWNSHNVWLGLDGVLDLVEKALEGRFRSLD